MPIRAALFDFDGTLADSFTAITQSTNHVLRSFGRPELTVEEVRHYVGFGLPSLMQELLPGCDLELAVARYREHHPSVTHSGTKLLAGVAETIPELARRGIVMAVCSNKMVHFTRDLVQHFGLAPYFQVVLGPDDVHNRAKPDPAMLLEALARLKIPSLDAVYVGDMAIDVRTAKAAGMPAWLVPGGASGHESPLDAGPDLVLKNFQELLERIP